jgi:hypothetical protein
VARKSGSSNRPRQALTISIASKGNTMGRLIRDVFDSMIINASVGQTAAGRQVEGTHLSHQRC